MRQANSKVVQTALRRGSHHCDRILHATGLASQMPQWLTVFERWSGAEGRAYKGKAKLSWRMSLDEAFLDGFEHSARSVPYAQLGEDVGDVVLHRSLRDEQGIRNFPIAISACHQTHDFYLALG